MSYDRSTYGRAEFQSPGAMIGKGCGIGCICLGGQNMAPHAWSETYMVSIEERLEHDDGRHRAGINM